MWLTTPILFLIYKRPEQAAQVFAQIKKQKPKRLYIAGDGAKKDIEWEQEIVEQTRKMVLDQIDWDCDVKTLFREENLWCKIWVSEAITWFFENEEMGIILEDDCFPSESFFPLIVKLITQIQRQWRNIYNIWS